DMVVEAKEGDGGPVVWRSRSTYLSRRSTAPAPQSSSGNRTAERLAATPGAEPTARWGIPPDIGRRYAAVSGDPNPIHLHPLTARLGGFRRPIAHGMWSLSRCVAGLGGRLPDDECTLDVSFRSPLPLPTRQVGFHTVPVSDGRRFALTGRGQCFVVGSVKAGAEIDDDPEPDTD
ncbi:MAG: MaoC family dehydratase, partial [Stackebrandtia sp.]